MTDVFAEFRLDGRVAVVIGGAGGLGGRIVAGPARAGAEVVVVGRDPTRGERAAARLRDAGGAVEFAACDASSRGELRAMVGSIVASRGRIDVLVNAAGVNSATPFLDIADDELERIVAVNQL